MLFNSWIETSANANIESCFSKMDILYLDWKNELTIKANPSQGGDAKLQGPLTGIASFRINERTHWERTYLLLEDRFCYLINEKGKPIVRWGRKAIGSWVRIAWLPNIMMQRLSSIRDRFFNLRRCSDENPNIQTERKE